MKRSSFDTEQNERLEHADQFASEILQLILF